MTTVPADPALQVEAFFDAATSTFTYLVLDPASRQCALVDSVLDAAYVIHPSALLQALDGLFEAEWDRAVPLLAAIGAEPDVNEPEADQRKLLGLLATNSAGIDCHHSCHLFSQITVHR